MATAQDVTVIIPVDRKHAELYCRAIESATNNGAKYDYLLDYNIFDNSIPDIGIGVCSARNTMIARTETDLILPLDADDYLLPGAVERMAQAWQPGKVVYGSWREEQPGGSIEYKPAPPPEMLNRKHICHATYLFAKEDWLRVGGYDPDFNIGAEDWEFMIALVEAGCELVKDYGDSLYVKAIGNNARTQKAVRRKDIIKQLLLEKHPGFFQTR